jgi:3'-phosphoadenosine 5'-phosphosulfate sulfotransferase (PAPS reductase)/FAD synthetase
MSMTDPFLITGPALISFSGGRTSGYMLWRILQAHGGTLPDDVHVAFANTGREREETLRFVHDCSVRWGVRVRWLEFVSDLRGVGVDGRFTEVGYNSAGRNGEPFERLIERKQAIPSRSSGRFCTSFLKVRPLQDFMESVGFPINAYTEVIGFRADERDRVFEFPLKPFNAARRFAFPLSDAGIRKSDVLEFWKRNDFDLNLPRGLGNCDHCPFMNTKIRMTRARIDPVGLEWWRKQEEAHDYYFNAESCAEIAAMTNASPLLLDLDDIAQDAADSECGGWC